MVEELFFTNNLKEGEYMTRICAVCNDREIAVSADSLFTSSLTNERSVDNLKLCYSDNMIIGILGTSEFITGEGKYSIRNHVQKYMNDNYQKGHEIDFIYELIEEIKGLFNRYMYEKPCCLIHFWKEGNHCYAYYYQIYARYGTFIGENKVIFFTDIGNISQHNKSLFDITHKMLICGDGLKSNPTFYEGNYSYPLDLSISKTREAILDTRLATIGGSVYTVQLNTEIKTYKDSKEVKW